MVFSNHLSPISFFIGFSGGGNFTAPHTRFFENCPAVFHQGTSCPHTPRVLKSSQWILTGDTTGIFCFFCVLFFWHCGNLLKWIMCFWYAVAVQIPGPNVSFSPFPVEVPDFIWPFYRLCELDVLQLSNRQKFREGKHSGWQILMSWGEKKRLETKLVVRFDWRVFFNSQPPPQGGFTRCLDRSKAEFDPEIRWEWMGVKIGDTRQRLRKAENWGNCWWGRKVREKMFRPKRASPKHWSRNTKWSAKSIIAQGEMLEKSTCIVWLWNEKKN